MDSDAFPPGGIEGAGDAVLRIFFMPLLWSGIYGE
jgi:hypothetical protein